MLILEAASELLPSIETWALPERSARGTAEGTMRGQRAKVSMQGRTEDAASNWLRIFPKQTFSRVFENIQTIHLGFQLINGGEEFSCNGNQRQIAFSITWTRQEPCGLVGSSVISDPGVPGSNSTAVNSLCLCHFFSQSEDSKTFQSLSHQRRWPPHMRASEVYKTSQQYPRMRVLMSC